MKPGAVIATLLLSLALLPGGLPAGEDAVPAKPPRTRMQDQLHRLIRAEAGQPAGPAAPVAEVEPETVAGTTLQLEPMIIEERKPMPPPPPPESRAEEFFRTGTVWEKVGPKFTRRFWIKGDRGILFTLSW